MARPYVIALGIELAQRAFTLFTGIGKIFLKILLDLVAINLVNVSAVFRLFVPN